MDKQQNVVMDNDLLVKFIERERLLVDGLLKAKDELLKATNEIKSEAVRNVELENNLKLVSAELIKTRGRLEPRSLIDYCETTKLPNLGVKIDKSGGMINRSKTWSNVWNDPSFLKYKPTAEASPALSSSVNKCDSFGQIILSMYSSQNKTIHSLHGNSIFIPSSFTIDQKPVLRAICDFVPISYEEE